MKKTLMMIILIISCLTISQIVLAKSIEVPDNIRVGIYYSSKAQSQITLSSPGGITIGVMKNQKYVYKDETDENEKIVISKSSKPGAVHIEGYGDIGSEDEYPYFKSNEKDGISLIDIDDKKYRGNVEIRRFSDSDMTVINHLSMQEYLYGVVPREIGGNSPIEAVKAQAIVARTYAAKNYGRRSKLGFDVMPTVDDQAYGGYEWENKNSNRAVDETNGQVVVYDGELIGGFYFSTSGGYTESSENVWGGKYDYLKAVPDTYEPNVEGNTSWEVKMTSAEVKKALSKKGINVGDIIDLVPVEYTDAGRILTLKIVGTEGSETISKSAVRTYLGLKSQWYSINSSAPQVRQGTPNDIKASDEEAELEIEKVNDEWFLKFEDETSAKVEENKEEIKEETKEEINEVQTEDAMKVVKSLFGFSNEQKEEVIEIKEDKASENIIINEKEVVNNNTAKEYKPLLKSILAVLNSNIFKLNFNTTTSVPVVYKAGGSDNTFIFRGRGWGHAVGMSQNGARGMADNGFSAEEIIKWYYSGVSIVG